MSSSASFFGSFSLRGQGGRDSLGRDEHEDGKGRRRLGSRASSATLSGGGKDDGYLISRGRSVGVVGVDACVTKGLLEGGYGMHLLSLLAGCEVKAMDTKLM